jgi:hypothetical protein
MQAAKDPGAGPGMQHTGGEIAAVTAHTGGPVAAPDSTATTVGTHTKHNHCPTGSAGEHRGQDGNYIRGDDAPASSRKPSPAERHVATPHGTHPDQK